MQFSKAMGACMCVTVRVVIYFISFLLTKSKCPNHSHHFGLGCASYIQLGASLLRQTQSVSLYFEPKVYAMSQQRRWSTPKIQTIDLTFILELSFSTSLFFFGSYFQTREGLSMMIFS